MTDTSAPMPFQGVVIGTWDILKDCDEPFVDYLGYRLKNDVADGPQHLFNELILQVCQFFQKSDNDGVFAPAFVIDGKRSLIPTDLHADALVVLAAAFDSCPHLDLKGRIGDVLWNTAKNMTQFKKARFGWLKDTVASYQALVDQLLPQQHDESVPYSHLRERMRRCGKMVVEVSNQPLADAYNAWLNGLVAKHAAGGHVRVVIDVRRIQLGHGWVQATVCCTELRQYGEGQLASGNHILATDFFDLALTAAYKTNDTALIKAAHMGCGNARIALAKAYLKVSSDAAAPAAHQYKQALLSLREAGADKALTDPVQQELLRLNLVMAKSAGTLSVPLDFTDYAKNLGKELENRNLTDALSVFFFSLHAPKGYAHHRASIDKKVSESVFFSMVPIAKMSADGRVQAVAGPLEDEDPAEPERIFYEVAEQQTFIGMAIRVSRWVFLEHHPIDEEVCEQVVNVSPVVPADRKHSVTLGLLRGWHGQWLESLHLLIPQLEHMIRKVLLDQGVVVTKTDPTQQDYIDLGGLLSNHEAVLAKFLGEGEVLALRAACTERLGHNRRNDLAHGLIPDGEFGSPADIYLWWLIFRIILKPLFNTAAPVATSSSSISASTPTSAPEEAK